MPLSSKFVQSLMVKNCKNRSRFSEDIDKVGLQWLTFLDHPVEKAVTVRLFAGWPLKLTCCTV